MADNVNHPFHYTQGKVETIDAIESSLGQDGLKDFCLGNAMKYISRCKYKGKFVEDLQKAIWYLNKAIQTQIGSTDEDSE